jgi:BirA family biotin operon repressor/biotin-[acetyl-CoA-carboxylase] ligase
MAPNPPSGPADRPTASSRWSDLDRPPLNAATLRRALVIPAGSAGGTSAGTSAGSLWTALDVVEVTGSTNTDLAERARAGEAEGAVLIAEKQSAGRGRLDRRWTAPARSGLFFSVLLRPGASGVPAERWGWLPLLAGVAVATALSRAAGVDTALKWPNDILVTVDGEERKAGGILAERTGQDGIVVGTGLNVTLRADELPVPGAGSLALAGAKGTDRDPLLRAVLRSLADWYDQWRAVGGDPDASRLRQTYAAGCATLGRAVRAELPGGRELSGTAVGIDDDGRLVIAAQDGWEEAVGSGDVVHVR